MSTAVVFPRRASGVKEGLNFWESIVKYPSAAAYAKEVMSVPDDEIARQAPSNTITFH
jgi:hypothetical protein